MTSGAEAWRREGAAWLGAALVIALAAAHSGWSPWLARFVQLMVAYGVARAGFAVFTRHGRAREIRSAVALAIALAAAGSAAGTALLRYANRSAGVFNLSLEFDLAIAALFGGTLLVSAILQREATARLMRERQLSELRLEALQAQIEPHFLYNTLANVQQLVRSSPAQADRMLESLIRYLKSVIPDVRSGRSTVAQELSRVSAYLAIMQVRMGERLRYEIDVPEALHGIEVPPLALLTLVENAVKHGLEGRPSGGRVRIAGRRDGATMRLTVNDDGAGFGPEAGTGTGLANLRERIAALHGERASLELAHGAPSGVEATLTLPAR